MLYCGVLLAVVLSTVRGTEKGQQCTTPDNKEGRCISVRECKTIINAIISKNETAIEFAKKSQCGFNDSQPLVCCEKWKNKILPETDTCGISTYDKIIPGIISQLAQYTWMTALEYKKKSTGENAGVRCAGALINNRYVLTSSGCLSQEEFEPFQVRLGEWDLDSDPDCEDIGFEKYCLDPVQFVKINKTILHPQYNKQSGNNDIGLIRLEKEIVYSELVNPICLPNSVSPSAVESSYSVIAGWGTTTKNDSVFSKLKHSSMSLLFDDECQQKMYSSKTLNSNEFCGEQRITTEYCLGSLGSPLMKQVDLYESIFYAEGILTWSDKCDSNNVTVYTQVKNYMSWILEVISKE